MNCVIAVLGGGRGIVTTVLVDVVAWVLISVVWGVVAGLVPTTLLERDSWVTKPRRWERGGRIYRRLGVHRWKDALPESNSLGPGQRTSKRHLPPRAELEKFVGETRRAEYVHLAIAGSGVAFLLWNPLWLGVVMVVFGFAFNLPFIVVQRYNRLRLQRVIARRPA